MSRHDSSQRAVLLTCFADKLLSLKVSLFSKQSFQAPRGEIRF